VTTQTPGWFLWLQATQIVFCIALAIYSWYSRQRAADRDAVRAIETTVSGIDHRVLSLEERIQHVPCQGQFTELKAAVDVLIERTKNLDGWLTTTCQRLERIEGWLRENR